MKHKTLSRLFAALLAVILICSLLPADSPAKAAESYVAVYDYDLMSYFTARSKTQVASNYAKAFYPENSSYVDSVKSSYYTVQPSLTAPYQTGILKRDTLSVMQSTVNFYRWLIGADSLSKTCLSTEALQAAALVRNFDFSHEVSDVYKPKDMPQALWELGKKADHNIISKYSTPQRTAAAWLDEGYNRRTGTWSSTIVGHRMIILDSSVSGIDFGYCGNCCVGRYTDLSGSTELPFLAYPAPGYMPLNDLPSQTSAWSIQLNKAKLKFSKASDLSVTVRNVRTGEAYTCTAANGKLKVCTLENGMEAIGYVQPPTASGKYYYDDGATYNITVTGLTDRATGYPAELRYTTQLFDVIRYISTTVTEVAASTYNTVTVYQPNTTAELLSALCDALPQTATVTGKTGFSVSAPISAAGWRYDSAAKVFRASVDPACLPSILSDPDRISQDVQIRVILDPNEKLSNSHLKVPEIITEGNPAEMKIWRYYNNLEHSQIYQIRSTGVRLRFDSYTDPYTVPEGTAYHSFSVDAVSTSDSGSYFGIYFSENPQVKEAFVTDCRQMQVVSGKQVGLLIDRLPDKLVYQPGEHIDLTGMVLLVTYDDGTTASLTDFSGFVLKIIDHNQSESTVEVTYGDHTVSFDVVYSTEASDYMLISRLPDQLCYERGDRTIDLTGGELLVYRTGKAPQAIPMTQAGVSGFDTGTVGEKMITLSYQGMTTGFAIQVNAKNYTITWKIGEKTYTTTVAEGTVPVFPDTPKVPGDRFYDYIFSGWDQPVTATKADTTYTACFTRSLREDCAANTFPDVDINSWYCKNVLQAVAFGLFSGTDNGTFAPTMPMTRAMLVTVLWSMEGKPEPRYGSPFTDVKKDAWYGKPVLWAAENDIVSGVGNGKFAPDMQITREQLAAILYKYSRARGLQGSISRLYTFPDASKVSKWAQTAYAWALENGILSGVKEGGKVYLKPLNSASRAEVATVLISYLRNFANIA